MMMIRNPDPWRLSAALVVSSLAEEHPPRTFILNPALLLLGKIQPFRNIATLLTCRWDPDVEPLSRRVSPRRRAHKLPAPSVGQVAHLAHLPCHARLMALPPEFDWRPQAAG